MSGSKYLLAVALGLLLAFPFFSQGYVYHKYKDNSLLFVNPLVFKALSNNMSMLAVDKLWLLSNSVGDFSKLDKNTTMKQFYNASKTITTLDPYFYKAISYSSTYLASIHKEAEKSNELLQMARYYDEKNFNLYLLEMVNMVTYHDLKDLDIDSIRDLATKAAALPEGIKIMGRIKVSDWVDDILDYVKNEEARRQQKLEDAKWLKKQTKNKSQSLEIDKRIQELK